MLCTVMWHNDELMSVARYGHCEHTEDAEMQDQEVPMLMWA